jgi:hypothetical protein
MSRFGRLVFRCCCLLVAGLCAICTLPGEAGADTYRTIVPAVYDPASSTNPDTLFGAAWGDSVSQVTVTCYHPAAANVACAGGGDFDKGDCPSEGSNQSNFATLIQDTGNTGSCWYRKNFGLNGVVDARQCGVYGDGLPGQGSSGDPDYRPDDGDTLNACLTIAAATNASDPALQNKLHIVTTGGGVVLANNADIAVPPNIELTCGDNGIGSVKDNDYRLVGRNLSNALVLNPTTANEGPYTVKLAANTSGYTDCTEVAGPGPLQDDGGYPNEFSPYIYYPNCKNDGCTAGATQPLLRSATKEYSAFNPNETAKYNIADSTCVDVGSPGHPKHCGPASASIGIHLTTAEHLTVRNVTVLGFGTCYEAGNDKNTPPKAGSRLVIDHLICDGDTGVSVDNSPNATQFNGIAIKPFLTSGGDTLSSMIIDYLEQDPSSTKYRVYVEVLSTTSHPLAFQFEDGDTVWIETKALGSGAGTGAESAAGRWTVENVDSDTTHCHATGDYTCQSFTLDASIDQPDSQATPLSLSGTLRNTTQDGVPPNAIVIPNTSPANAALQLVAVGQTVSGSCIPTSPAPTVTDVWPTRGLIYMSAPATCATVSPATITFTDNTFNTDFTPSCGNPPSPVSAGCAAVDANERFGDGYVITNSGGVSAINCNTYEHLVAFHFSTNANSSRFANCGTGENDALPDQEIVGLKIDGDHTSTDPGDACGNEFVNGILGQHRSVGVLVQSNCATPNHISNVRFSGTPGGRRNAVGLEVDAGTVAVTNGDATGNDNVLKADSSYLYKLNDDGSYTQTGPFPSTLSIGNNQFPNATLYMADDEAAASTNGCGNTFATLTAYLCTPPPATLLPGGRLTLTQTQAVMRADVVNGANVYYVPSRGEQVPIYNSGAANFGLQDIGTTGLTLALDASSSTKQLSGKIYDIFAEVADTGSLELCSGPYWTSSTSRTTGIQQVQGIWVNTGTITCHAGTHDFSCLSFQCTYLGSMYMTADGKTTQQLGPDSHAHGNANCLCLYNAYNRVPVISMSLDSSATYTNNSTTWHAMNPATFGTSGLLLDNTITVLDGLGESAIDALLNDALKATGSATASTPSVGLTLNSTSTAPQYFASNQAVSTISVSAPLRNPPFIGLWYVQAMEVVSSAASSPSFGGNGQQQMSVTVSD